MSLVITQTAVSLVPVLAAIVPAGATVTVCASLATSIGTSATVTTGSGFTLPANVPVTFTIPDSMTGVPVTLYAVTATTSSISVAVTS